MDMVPREHVMDMVPREHVMDMVPRKVLSKMLYQLSQESFPKGELHIVGEKNISSLKRSNFGLSFFTITYCSSNFAITIVVPLNLFA